MRLITSKTLLATAMGSAVLFGLAACGGGSDAPDAASADTALGKAQGNGADLDAQAKLRPRPAPIDPNPVVVPVDATLALASTTADGRAADGAACAISADGSQVALTSTSGILVTGGVNNLNNVNDTFVKNLRTGAITRASTRSDGSPLQMPATCVGMTPDANFVVFTTPQANGAAFTNTTIEPAIYVKNLRTGALTNVNPPLNRFANVARYSFQSISDDGNRVALIAEPTGTYVGGYETVANGPARALVRDIRSGELIDLSPTVSLDLSQASVTSNTVLSPDGSKLAFNSRSNYPALRDTNGAVDLFVLDIASRAVSLVSSVGSSLSFQANAPVSFLANGSKLAFLGAASGTTAQGVYIKDLGTGATRVVFSAPVGQALPTPVSLSGDGNVLAYTRPYFVSGRQEAIVRNVITGQEQLVNMTAAGIAGNGESRLPLLSRDGSRVVFDSNSTNLVRPTLPAAYLYRPFVKTLAPAAGQIPQ